MQEFSLSLENGKNDDWCKRELEKLENIFLKDGGLWLFFYNHVINNMERCERRYWLVFSKEEEEMIEEIARKFFPPTADRVIIFLNAILDGGVRSNLSVITSATYINPNTATTEGRDEMLLAIRIRWN